MKSKTVIAAFITGTLSLIGVFAAIYFQKPSTQYASQTMENSPGGLQVQGGDVIVQESKLHLDYELKESIRQVDGTYSNKFLLTVSSKGGIDPKDPPPIQINKILDCKPATMEYAGMIGDFSNSIQYSIVCISSEKIIQGSSGDLFSIKQLFERPEMIK